LVALAALLWASPADSAPAIPPGSPPPTFGSYLHKLTGDDRSDRLFAGRVLRRQVRGALRATRRDRPGRLAYDAGLAALDEFDRELAPACIATLDVRNVAGLCADILGLLETQAALEPLREARAGEERARTQRRIDRAITRITAAR